MLTSLHIRNFAIIEDVTLEWGSGLNVLSGETGAGKSIIIQAVSLLMGERGNSEWIRKGEDEAIVTGLFEVGGQRALLEQITELGVPLQESEILIQRTLSRSGRNQVRLNGMPATVAMLGQIAEHLVDLVSQQEHELLLRAEAQRIFLDRFGGLDSLREDYQARLEELRSYQHELADLESSVKANQEMEEFLRFQLREIEEAKLKVGEDEELRTEKGLIKNAARLGELCTFAEELLDSGDDTVSHRLGQLANQLAKVDDLDPQLAELSQLLQSIQVQLDEVARTLGNYLQGLQFEPGRLDAIESRLAEIDRFKKKYGATIAGVLAHAEDLQDKLEGLDSYDVKVEELQAAIGSAGRALEQTAEKLQAARNKVAKRLEKEVGGELSDLGMGEARLEVRWEAVAGGLLEFQGRCYDRFGASRVVLYLMSNPGEDAKPLVRIASGGERSRILLAIRKVLADDVDLGTAIYDEVDEGVGGATASKIGEKLAELGKKRQVICITHRPQIAAYARHHFVIRKDKVESRVRTTVRLLEEPEREQELARMLAGKVVTTKAHDHAREMLRGVTR